MTTATTEAIARKQTAMSSLSDAYYSLRAAQNAISDVEGDGSADIYTEIADLYESVYRLQGKLQNMNPTGIFS